MAELWAHVIAHKAEYVALVAAIVAVVRIYAKGAAAQRALNKVAGVLEVLRGEPKATAEDAVADVAEVRKNIERGDPLAVLAIDDAVRVADPKRQPRNFWGHFSDIVIGPTVKGFVDAKLRD